MASKQDEKIYTAIILVIGNEILNGKTLDTNSQFIAQRLFARGIDVTRIITIPDIITEIVREIQLNSPKCDLLFAMGGIGSTPDDLTRQAFAEAFNVPLVRHPEAEAIIRGFARDRINESRLQMADLPKGAQLIPNPYLGAPGFIIHNCYVFPGIPELLVGMYEEIQSSLPSGPRFMKRMKLDFYEGEFSEIMDEVQKEFPLVQIGSYPAFRNPEFKVELTFQGRNEDLVEKAMDKFKMKLEKITGKS